jgi:hypothetical protein
VRPNRDLALAGNTQSGPTATVGVVPIVAAAVCPYPPMLVPEVASGAAPELDDLRAACADAIRHLVAAGPDWIMVVGSGPTPTGAEIGRRDLPLSLAIGEWLLGDAGPYQTQQIASDAPPDTCVTAGRLLAQAEDRVALLVMGDGSACRGPKSPGYDDPRAEGFDRTVADALARADADALLAVDPGLARELRCAGRAPWQVLAGVLGDGSNGGRWRGELRYDQAPYGVAYFVAIMKPAP